MYICYVKFGEVVRITPDVDKAEKILELRDMLATLKWDIWSMFPVEQRRNIAEDEWEKEKKKRLADYPKLNYEYENSCILQVK